MQGDCVRAASSRPKGPPGSWLAFFLAMGLTWAPTSAFAGLLIAPSLKWVNFGFRPEAEEPTANFYGYGLGVEVGYSLARVIDLSIGGQYVPATRKPSGLPFPADASLLCYGGGLALRLFSAVYLGVRAGPCLYSLLVQTDDTEVVGQWLGSATTWVLGGMVPINRTSYLQVAFEAASSSVTDSGGANTVERGFDALGISLSYVFNSVSNSSFENALYGTFVNSFWSDM